MGDDIELATDKSSVPHSPHALSLAGVRRIGVPSAVAITLLSLNILVAACYYSQILKFLGGNLFEWINRSMYVVGGVTLFIGLILGELTACLLSVALMAYFFAMVYVGSYYGYSDYRNSMFLPYLPLAAAPIISFMLRSHREWFLLRAISCISILYFLFYAYFSWTLRAEDFTGSGSGFIKASGDREARIALEPAITCLGYYLGLSGLRRGHNVILSLFVFLMGVTAMFFAHARGFTTAILAVSLIYVLFPNKRFANNASLWLFLSGAIIMMFLFAQNVNVYSFGAGDPSLHSRMEELQTISRGFSDYPIFGRGFYIPSFSDDNTYIDYDTAVFWSDMGVYGILWAGGAVGLFLFVGLSVAIIKSNSLISKIGLSPILSDTMLLSFAACGAQGFTTPIFWGSGIILMTFYLAFVATRLTTRRVRFRIVQPGT